MGTVKKRALLLTSPEQSATNNAKKHLQAKIFNKTMSNSNSSHSVPPGSVAPTTPTSFGAPVVVAPVAPAAASTAVPTDVFSWHLFDQKLGNMLDKKL